MLYGSGHSQAGECSHVETQLLERGTDIGYIQALLEHESSKTTERYTHVTKKGFERSKSPLDDLGLGPMPNGR